MFYPRNKDVVAPITTAVFRSMRVNESGEVTETFTQYLEELRCSNTNTIATVGGMLLFLADDAGAQNKTSKASSALFRPGAAKQILNSAPELKEDPSDENKENIFAARANIKNAISWIMNLLNAAHKKPLTPDNVDGFFAMLRHKGTSGAAVSWFINSISPFYPDSVSISGFRALLAPGVWTEYRITRVTTGVTMWKNIDVFRGTGITTEGNSIEKAIEASANSPWDVALSMKIPDKYKAYMCLYLEAAGTPIDNWYQGSKARDELPAARARGAKEIFRRYLEVKNNVEGLNKLNTVATFESDPRVTGFW